MHHGARTIAVEAGWRLQKILRAQRYFTTPELVRLYKSHVLSYVEGGTPAYFHASASTLSCIDRVQRRFLRAIGISEEEALLNFRLAPLPTRRCIAILGLLHRVVLGNVSAQIAEIFPRASVRSVPDAIAERVRGRSRHDKQLFDRVDARSSEQFKRSAFGMVQCYNALPQSAVDILSVKSSQRNLQLALMAGVRRGHEDWQSLFQEGRRYASLIQFQRFFD